MNRIFNFALISFFAILSLTLSSCEKDDSDNDTTVDKKDTNTNNNNNNNNDNNNNINDNDRKDDVIGEIVVISDDGFASGDNIFRAINKSSFYINDIKYSIVSDHLEVTGYDKDRMKGSPKIVGNVKYEGKLYKVTIIGEGAFEDCTILTSITLPNTIIDIDHFAFMNCKNLTSVTMSNSVEWMGNSAFFYCSSLKTIKLSSSLTNIGKYSFEGCTALTSITIPNSVTIINHYAFHGSGLTSIDIPNSVTEIGKNAFAYCKDLTSITISSSVVSFDYQTIYECHNLANLKVDGKNAVFSSEDNVLFNKDKTKLLYCVPKKSGAYTIPSSVKGIENSALSNCVGLTSVTIPSSVTNIGTGIFYYCSGLTSIHCKAKNVPYASSALVGHENCTLYVPKESVDAYKSTYPWNTFKNIIGE